MTDYDCPRLFVHGVTAEEWTKRYGVEAFTYPCSECGRPCTTTLPYAQGQLRGLQSPPCECGNDRTPFGYVRDPKYGDLFTGLEVKEPRRARGVRSSSRGKKRQPPCP